MKPHCDFHKKHQQSCSECAYEVKIAARLKKEKRRLLGQVKKELLKLSRASAAKRSVNNHAIYFDALLDAAKAINAIEKGL